MNSKLRLILALFCIAIAACNKPDPVRPTPPSNQTWIDAPIHGSTLPMAPYKVVFHAASPSGIESFEVQINGVVLNTVAPTSTGSGGSDYGTLFQGESTWTPPAPGTYLVSVRSKSSGGPFGPSAQAQVTVVSDLELQASTPPALLTSPATEVLPVFIPPPSPTPAPTPTATFTPTPVQVDEGVPDPQFSSEAFYYRGSCSPKQLTIEVSIQDPIVYSVVLFYRLKGVDSGETTDWTNVPMTPLGGGYFNRTLQSETDIPGFNRFLSSTLQVQIVATKQDGTEIGRTGVLSEVILKTCAAAGTG